MVELDGKLNQLDSLEKHSEIATEYFPNQSLFWYQNGFANYAKKNYDKATQSLEQAQMLAVDNFELLENINSLLGDAYNNTKQYDKSDKAYETVLKDNPENEYVMNNYSYFLSLRKQKLDRAAELSSKLAEKNPTNVTYLDTYAWVLYVKKEYKKANEVFEQALKQEGKIGGTILEHYGDVLFQLGKKTEAIEQWKKAKLAGGASAVIDKKIQQGQLVEE